MTSPLAVIGEITHVAPITGADRIHHATVACGTACTWQGVAGKEFKPGDLVTVFLQDALLPEDARWAFMAARGWRIKMLRFKGVPSECLIVSKTHDLPAGSDLTDLPGCEEVFSAAARIHGGRCQRAVSKLPTQNRRSQFSDR